MLPKMDGYFALGQSAPVDCMFPEPRVSVAEHRRTNAPASRLRDHIPLLTLLLFAAGVSVIGIRRPMLVDESASVIISSYDFAAVLSHLRLDNSMPLYYVFLHGWTEWFGISEIATRVPSVLFYLLAILIVWRIGKEVSGNARGGLYAAFCYAISLQAIHLAQRVRMYSLLGLLAALSTWLFFRVASASRNSRWDWVLYTAVNTLGAFTQVWFAFLLIAQFICHCTFSRRSTLRLLASISVAGGCFCFTWGPSFLHQLRNGSTNWIPALDLWSFTGFLLEFYGGEKIGVAFLIGCGLLLIAGRGATHAMPGAESRRGKMALLLIFGICIGVALLISLFKPVYWPGRYTIVALPALAVLLGWELAEAVSVRLATAAALSAMLFVMLNQWMMRDEMFENSQTYSTYQYTDKNAAEELAKRVRPGDEIIFTGLSRASIEYYFRRFHRERDVILLSYPTENAEHVGWDNQKVDEASLNAQAQAIIEDISAAKPRAIWIVAGKSPLPNRILFSRIRSHFMQSGVLPVIGAFFNGVAIFDSGRAPVVRSSALPCSEASFPFRRIQVSAAANSFLGLSKARSACSVL
jgi:Dolichyl-phosphate-mannose-protein mannosyltransferase